MPEFLPLCVSTQDLLPGPCRCCAWWQTAGIARVSPETAATVRERWTNSLEDGWANPGLIRLVADEGGNWVVHYAPAGSLPRLRDVLLGQLAPEAVVLFCLRHDGPADRQAARRLLHAALKQLKQQHLREAYAFAVVDDGTPQEERCEFFSYAFLRDNGFEELHDCGDVLLMRADLRALLSVLAPLEMALRRLLHHEPAPSPAAWSTRRPA